MSPPDTQSRLAIVLLVGFFFFMIPRELNKLNHLLDLSSKYTVSAPLFPRPYSYTCPIIPRSSGMLSAVDRSLPFLAQPFHHYYSGRSLRSIDDAAGEVSISMGGLGLAFGRRQHRSSRAFKAQSIPELIRGRNTHLAVTGLSLRLCLPAVSE